MARPVTEDERRLLNHVSMHGIAGYPIRHLGVHRWIIDHPALKHPEVFRTKRKAALAIDAFLDIVREALAEEGLARHIADLKAAGWSDEKINGARRAACAEARERAVREGDEREVARLDLVIAAIPPPSAAA